VSSVEIVFQSLIFFKGMRIWGESVGLVRFLGYYGQLVIVEIVCVLIWDELMEKLDQKSTFFLAN